MYNTIGLVIIFIIIVIVVCIIIIMATVPSNNTNNKDFNIQIENYNYNRKISKSQGIITDSEIVSNIIADWNSSPYFNYEDSINGLASDWIFVNLDVTRFGDLFSKNAPQHILCKTRQTYDILKQEYPPERLHHCGFTSLDRYDASIVKNYNWILHAPGKSPFKGTKAVINAWIKHPEWPILHVVCRDDIASNVNGILGSNSFSNIIIIDHFIPEAKLNKLMNECGAHLCPSKHEGFGHYLHEAKSVAAVVLYTDAPSMNETFAPYVSGIPIEYTDTRTQNKLCPKYIVSPSNIEKAVNYYLTLTEEEKVNMGLRARRQFLHNDKRFKQKFYDIIHGDKIPSIIHNVWISKDNPFIDVPFPSSYDKYKKTWKVNNPDFEHEYWSGGRILNLISAYFPQYLEFYKHLEPTISKCDFARFAIIAVYGGLYTDLDFMCLKNIQPLLSGTNYFVFEPKTHWKKAGYPPLCNGFFAAVAGDKFVLSWLDQMTRNKGTVIEKTGPFGLYQHYLVSKDKILIGSTCDCIPLDDQNTLGECKGQYDAYVATNWHAGTNWQNESTLSSLIIMMNPLTKDELTCIAKIPFNNASNTSDLFNTIQELMGSNSQGYNMIATMDSQAVILSQALPDNNIYVADFDKDSCDYIYTLKLLNSTDLIFGV